MIPKRHYPSAELSVYKDLLATATSEASAAMCRWSDGTISMTLSDLYEVDICEVCAALGVGDEISTMVVVSVPGPEGGEMLLTFNMHAGRRLAAVLLGHEEPQEGPLSELERSVLMETGNILGCAYLNGLSRLIGAELIPMPPTFIEDYAASVVQQAVSTQAAADKVLVCRTDFHSAAAQLGVQVIFLPTADLKQRLQQSLVENLV